MELSPEQREYLAAHRLAVLGTGRRDGSPQLSLIMYHFDGSELVISVTSDRAKWRNVRRQPRVSLLVPDGRRQLILYGTADAIDDDAGIVAGHRRIREAMNREVPSDEEAFLRELREQRRVILRVSPERVFMND